MKCEYLGCWILAAEEGLIEVVDPGVEGTDVGSHFLAESCDIGAYFLAKRYQHSQQGNAGADDGKDDLGGVAHGVSLSHRCREPPLVIGADNYC